MISANDVFTHKGNRLLTVYHLFIRDITQFIKIGPPLTFEVKNEKRRVAFL